jgi:hypothetical protein
MCWPAATVAVVGTSWYREASPATSAASNVNGTSP